MTKKKGNITVVLLAALLTVCTGAALISTSISSKYAAKDEYMRLRNRYIAESGVDMASGLVLSYLAEQEYTLAYTKDADGIYTHIDSLAPYILDEIREAEDSDSISLPQVENEVKDYLSSVGYIDFRGDGFVKVAVSTPAGKDKLKLPDLCTESNFLIRRSGSDTERSRLKPIYLNLSAGYAGGRVEAAVKIDGLYAQRYAFSDSREDETESVNAWIDISGAVVEITNYQNMISGG